MSEPDKEFVLHQAHLERAMWGIHRYWTQFFRIPLNQQSITASIAQENMELKARVEHLEGAVRLYEEGLVRIKEEIRAG